MSFFHPKSQKHKKNSASNSSTDATATLHISVEQNQPDQKTAVNQPANSISRWEQYTLENAPDALPFTKGKTYISHLRQGPDYGGESRIIFADGTALRKVVSTIESAEVPLATVTRENGLPALQVPAKAFQLASWKGQDTDFDQNHAVWLVYMGLTPTGRVRKYPYEVHFSVCDGEWSGDSTITTAGSIYYRPDGTTDKMVIYYHTRSGSFEVRFGSNDQTQLTPAKITTNWSTSEKKVIWAAE